MGRIWEDALEQSKLCFHDCSIDDLRVDDQTLRVVMSDVNASVYAPELLDELNPPMGDVTISFFGVADLTGFPTENEKQRMFGLEVVSCFDLTLRDGKDIYIEAGSAAGPEPFCWKITFSMGYMELTQRDA